MSLRRTPPNSYGPHRDRRSRSVSTGGRCPHCPVRASPPRSGRPGVLSWRTTRRDERPRGAFCGIGSCFDCLATVNGQPNQRACLVPARPGDEITTQEGHGRADLAV